MGIRISQSQQAQIWYFRIFNTVFLENIPLFFIQCIFLSQGSDISFITLLAMTFSIISMLFSLLTVAQRFFDCLLGKEDIFNGALFIEYQLKERQSFINFEEIKNYHVHSHQLLSSAL